jgi:hypothetical protein
VKITRKDRCTEEVGEVAELRKIERDRQLKISLSRWEVL